jgi:signal transduction histidine kinase
VNATPLRDEEGVLHNGVAVLHNITTHKRAEEALLKAKDAAEAANRAKSPFLANMSHELRTPLNSLLILAKLLSDNKENNLTPKQVEFAQTIHSSGTDLLNLINEILDLSKVEAGKMEVNVTEVPVQDIEAFTRRSFEQVAQQKGLALTVDVQPEVPQTIVTDGQRLQQVIKNLLSNAFKFTEQGGVTLTIRKAEKGKRFASRILDQADTVIAFAVSDTGIGIPKDKQQLIFEAFQQADGTTSRKFGGTGLGLTISRQIAALLGGEIRVESTPGRGSTFTLFLPGKYVDPEPNREEASSPARRRESWGGGGSGSGGSRGRPSGAARAPDIGATT